MDPDLVILALLAQDRGLRRHYLPWRQETQEILDLPESAVLYRATTEGRLLELDGPPLMAELTCRIAQIARTHTVRRAQVPPPLIIERLWALNRVTQETPLPQRLDAESAFRSWFKRALLDKAAAGQLAPAGQSADPVGWALERLDALNHHAPLHRCLDDGYLLPLRELDYASGPRLESGIGPLDQEELDGGFERGTVVLLAGESNVGKTHLGIFLALHCVLQGGTALIVSSEDGVRLLTKRLLVHVLRTPSRQIAAMNREELEAHLQRLYGENGARGPGYLDHLRDHLALRVVDRENFYPAATERIMGRMAADGRPPDLVVSDYLQNASPNPTDAPFLELTDQRLDRIVTEHREIAERRQCVQLIISQIRTTAVGIDPAKFSARDAVARGYAALYGANLGLALLCGREEQARIKDSEDKRARCFIDVFKNKDGTKGRCAALSDLRTGAWNFFRTGQQVEEYLRAHPPAARPGFQLTALPPGPR